MCLKSMWHIHLEKGLEDNVCHSVTQLPNVLVMKVFIALEFVKRKCDSQLQSTKGHLRQVFCVENAVQKYESLSVIWKHIKVDCGK